jgi:hypothetical protein
MKKLLIGAAVAVVPLALSPPAHAYPVHAQPNQGDQCWVDDATATGPNGQTMTCTHLPQSWPGPDHPGGSGHFMYWEYGGAQDAYRTTPSGYKTDQPPFPHVPGGPPCNENDGIVINVTARVVTPSKTGDRLAATTPSR